MQAWRVLGDGAVECNAYQMPFVVVGADVVGNEKEFVGTVNDGVDSGTDGWHGSGCHGRSRRRRPSVICLAGVNVICKEVQLLII